VDNSTGAVYQAVTAQAVYSSTTNTSTGSVFIAKSPEVFTYDADGNLTSDGHWTNRWDAENRLIAMEPLSNTPTGAKQSLKFTYDSQWRRISKTVSNWNGSAWTLSYDNRFVYDDWNLISEVNSTNKATVCSYMWGLDLSGSLQGAGGVGGLIALNRTGNTADFAAFDGNGNVASMVGGSTGTATAVYEYGVFGELIRKSGSTSGTSGVRFSSKYADSECEFLYYGYRSYSAATGKWVTRDPLEETGSADLYTFAFNNSISWVDSDGLAELTPDDRIQRPWPDPRINNDTSWRGTDGKIIPRPDPQANPGRGQPPSVISSPASATPPDSAVPFIVKGIEMAGDALNNKIHLDLIAKGKLACTKIKPPTLKDCSCCKIEIYLVPGAATGKPSWYGGYGNVVDKPCSKLRLEGPSPSGELRPYYGKNQVYDPVFVPW